MCVCLCACTGGKHGKKRALFVFHPHPAESDNSLVLPKNLVNTGKYCTMSIIFKRIVLKYI